MVFFSYLSCLRRKV